MSNSLKLIAGFFVLAFSLSAFPAGELAGQFSISGTLLSPSSVPVTENVIFKLGIYNPAETCLIYEETQSFNTASTAGKFSLTVGSGARTGSDLGLSMRTVMLNSLALGTSTFCSGGYSAASGDARKLKITVSYSGVSNEVLSPLLVLSPAPSALVAESLSDGLSSSQILKVNAGSNVTQSNVDAVFTNFSQLQSLINGTSPVYSKVTDSITGTKIHASTPPSTPVTGSLWVAGGQLKFYDGAATQTVSTGGGGGTVTSVSGTAPISVVNGTTTPNISIATANTSATGVLSSVDWNTFNNKLGTSLPLDQVWVGNGSNLATPRTLNISDIKSTTTGGILGVTTCSPGQALFYVSASDKIECQSFSVTSGQVSSALGFTPANPASVLSTGGGSLTGSLSSSSSISANTLIAGAGSASAPSHSFSTSSTTGLYSPSVNVIGISTNGLSRLLVNATGNVGVGTAAPTVKLDVVGAINSTLDIYTPANMVAGQMQPNPGTAGSPGLNFGGTNTGIYENAGDIGFTRLGTATLKLTGTSLVPVLDNTISLGLGTFRYNTLFATNGTINTSDARLKKNISESDLGLDFVMKLKPVSYQWKTGESSKHYGVIAQELEKAIQTETKLTEVNGIIDYDKKSDRYGVRYTELIAPIIKAIQEIHELFSNSDERITALEKENSELKARLARIEEKLN